MSLEEWLVLLMGLLYFSKTPRDRLTDTHTQGLEQGWRKDRHCTVYPQARRDSE